MYDVVVKRSRSLSRLLCVTVPKFVPIGQTIAAELWLFFDFWRFDLLYCCPWPPTRSSWWSLFLCKIWLESTTSFVCEFQCYATLTWQCLFTPLLGFFWGKYGEKGNFYSFYLSRNACNILGLIVDRVPTNRTATKSLLRFSLGTPSKIRTTKK